MKCQTNVPLLFSLQMGILTHFQMYGILVPHPPLYIFRNGMAEEHLKAFILNFVMITKLSLSLSGDVSVRMCVRACVCERVRGKGKESESGGDREGEKGRREGERRESVNT